MVETSLNDLDVSSYPLLRIDQLPCHAFDLLQKCRNDLKFLLEADSYSSSSLSVYVNKLLSAIDKELSCRGEALKKAENEMKPSFKSTSFRVPLPSELSSNLNSGASISDHSLIHSEKKIQQGIKSTQKDHYYYNEGKNKFTRQNSTARKSQNNNTRRSGLRSRAKDVLKALKQRDPSYLLQQKSKMLAEQKRARAERARARIDALKKRQAMRESRRESRSEKKEDKVPSKFSKRNIANTKSIVDLNGLNADNDTKVIDDEPPDQLISSIFPREPNRHASDELENESISSGSSVSMEIENNDVYEYETDHSTQATEDSLEKSESHSQEKSSDELISSNPGTAVEIFSDLKNQCSNEYDPGNVNDLVSPKSEVDIEKQEDEQEPTVSNPHTPIDQSSTIIKEDEAHNVTQDDKQNYRSCLDFTGYNKQALDDVSDTHCSNTEILQQTSTSLSSMKMTKQLIIPDFRFTDRFPSFKHIFSAFYPPISKLKSWEEYGSIVEDILKIHTMLFNVLSDLEAIEHAHDNTTSIPSITDLFFRVKSSRPEVSTIVIDNLECLGSFSDVHRWSELPSGLGLGSSWNLLWTWSKPSINWLSLLIFQKVNHFQGARNLARKDLLKRNIGRYCGLVSGVDMILSRTKDTHGCSVAPLVKRKNAQEAFNIMPQTFILPKEFNSFAIAFSNNQKVDKINNIWILKPVRSSRGRNISLVSDIGLVSYADECVLQKYITNPLLLNGYKFDIRVYVLVTSFNPLEAFLYHEGFARFGLSKFSNDLSTLNDESIHLTNSSLHKFKAHEVDLDHPIRQAGNSGGENKVSMTWLYEVLTSKGFDVGKMKEDMEDVCLKALFCVDDCIPYQPNSFEVFGFDIMFDELLKPWLIEINASPSLSTDTYLDSNIKDKMIQDTIKLVDPINFDRMAFIEISKRRLKEIRSNNKTRGRLSEKEQLEIDLKRILQNKLPRSPGDELPAELQRVYHRLAPGLKYDKLATMVKRKA